MIGPLLGTVVPAAAAYWALAPASFTRRRPAARLLVAALAMGLTAGVTSCLWFVWLVLAGPPGAAYFAVEAAAVAIAAGLGRALAKRRGDGSASTGQCHPAVAAVAPAVSVRSATAVVIALALTWLAWFAVATYRRPHGSWDAVSIWNLHARVLASAGDHWAEFFRHGGTCGWQADYPLLVPAAVARLISLGGAPETAVGALVAFWFAAATVLLIAAVVAWLRGAAQALLAAATLLGTSFFVRNSASQYADLPLAWFIAAALSCVVMSRHDRRRASCWLLAAGLASGLAAWTKNEGLLFVAAVALIGTVVSIRRHGVRAALGEAGLLAAGSIPVLLLAAYFKLTLAPPSYLAAGLAGGTWQAQLLDPTRYLAIAGGMTSALVRLARGFLLALPLYAFLMGWADAPRTRASARLVLAVLALMLIGFAATYAITPLALDWQLRTSARRLLLQLWPTAVMAFFLATGSREERGDVLAC